MTIQDEKTALRRHLRHLRQRLTLDDVARLSDAICGHILDLPVYLHATSIALYLSANQEVDTSSLVEHAWRMNKRVFVPVVEQAGHTMRFVPYRPGELLQRSSLGIFEPVFSVESCTPVDDLELLFLPLLGFDRQGQRLGYGGGYFDRFFAQAGNNGGQGRGPLRIGLAYAFQELPALPHEAHDIALHAVVSETGFRPFAQELFLECSPLAPLR